MQESTLSAVVASEHDLQIMLLDENKRERRAIVGTQWRRWSVVKNRRRGDSEKRRGALWGRSRIMQRRHACESNGEKERKLRGRGR